MFLISSKKALLPWNGKLQYRIKNCLNNLLVLQNFTIARKNCFKNFQKHSHCLTRQWTIGLLINHVTSICKEFQGVTGSESVTFQIRDRVSENMARFVRRWKVIFKDFSIFPVGAIASLCRITRSLIILWNIELSSWVGLLDDVPPWHINSCAIHR